MNYLITAFGYELIVGQTGRGTWTGGYREAGSKGGYSAVGEYPDARSAQIATCKEVQVLAGQVGETVMDPCTEVLSAWQVE
jgi:hypothetical protein